MKRFLSFCRGDVGKTLAMTVGSPSVHRRGNLLKPLFLAMLFLIAGIGNVWAGEKTTTYVFKSKSWTAQIGATDANWTSGKDGAGFSNNGVQVTTNATGANATSPSSFDNISKIVVTYNTNASKGAGTLGIKIGTNDEVTKNWAYSSGTGTSANYTLQYDYETPQSGSIKITANTTTNSIYVVSIAITYDDGGDADPVLQSIAVSGTPSTTTYEAGDKFAVAGLVVTGTYDKGDPAPITEDITWEARTNSTSDAVALANYTLTQGQTALQVRATVGEIQSVWYDVSGLTVNAHTVTPGTYNFEFNNAFWGTSCSGSGCAESVSKTQNDVSIAFTYTSGTTLYINNSETRAYAGHTLTISVPSGYVIRTITGMGGSVSAGGGQLSSGTWSGKSQSVSFSFTGKTTFTDVSVTYEAITPEVTVDPSSLSFEAKQNIAVDGKTFTLTGANLSSDLTLAASAGFTVSPTSLTAEAAMAQGGVEVTVTPATPTTTTTPVEGTVTISGGGLASDVEVALSMAVTPTYLVAIAVNDDDMGSATLNGGTASIYVTDDEEIALVATPESGHEFVNWTVSDDDIVLDDKNAASTTAMAGAAGTITANFQAQVCTGLAAPVLDDVTTTYQSATIAWNAVDNAEGYVLNLKKHEGNVSVVTDELIVAPTVSFEKTGLAANTQYDYTVMAVGDGTAYCDESNPLLEGNFTTSDYPSVTVTYSENGNTDNQVSKKIQTAFALPTKVTNEISGKTFVGWTTKFDFEDGDESDEETYFAKGADFTITSNAAVTLYAVYATAGSGDVTISSTPLTSAPEQGAQYVIGANHKTAGIKYFSTYSGTGSDLKWGTMDASTTIYFTLSGTTSALTAYDGSAYLKNRSGGFEMSTTSTTIALQADGAIRGSSEETATRLRYNSDQDSFGLRWYASDKSTGNPAYFYKVEQNVSYSDYVISGSAALPKLEAPEFGGIVEGIYYEAQNNITLSAADGATIYFVIDEEEITEQNRTEYTVGAISLSDYGVHTVKAIAVKDGYENSDVATATYTIGKEFASVSALYTYLSENSLTSLNNVKVTGLVSRITTAWDAQKGYLTYYISDNGVAENDMQMFRGAGEGASALAVGDQVTVTGNYTLFQSTTHEFGAGNTIVARTAGAHDSYEIAGNLGKTNFAAGEKWLDSYLSGLSVNDVYNTGYKAAVSGVSFSADKTDQTALESTDTQITVTATKDQAELATKDFAITVSSATLVSIALKDGYKTEYYVGDELVKPTVIATLSDYSQIEETATACTGYNMSVAGNYTVSVAFTYGENTIDEGVEYQITVKAIYNNDDAPHTVAEALDIIGQYHNTSTASSDSIVVAGIVSRLDGSYVNTYWISDDGQTNNELEVYRGTYLGKVSFTTNNQLHVGDEVVVKGKVKTYSNTKEFDTGSRLVSLARTPNFEVADVAEALEINISEDLGVEDLTITKEGEGAVTLVSSDETKVSIVNGKLHAVAAAENVEITANLAANGIYKANSDVFHVSVIAERTRYTVSFDANGGTGTDPVIANQLPGATVDLPENPYSKANSAFDAWVVNDGAVEITDGHFTMPEGNVTIKATWNEVETTRIIFNVNGNTNVIAAVDAPQTVKYDITQTAEAISGYEFYGWAVAPETDDVTAAIDTILSYTPQAGENEPKVLYAVFKRTNVGNNKKYTLDYANESALANSSSWGAYGKSYEYTATDGSVWTVKAYKNSGMQMNTGKDCSIKIPDCPAKIVSIKIACAQAKALGLSASDYSGTGTITYIVYGTDATSQTLDFTGKEVTGGYIVPKGGSTVITKIEVEYDGTEVYYTTAPAAVYDVTYNLGSDPDGAWKANEGCDDAKVKAGQTYNICTDEPVRDGYKFNGWTVGGSAVSGTITINGDTTITADWIEKQNVALTYSDGAEDPAISAAGDIEEGTVITLPAVGTGDGQINFSKSGYDFKGWKYNGKNYKAGASFTMPASEAVQFVAQWKKQNLEKVMLISSLDQLISGMEVVFAYQDANDASKSALNGDISEKYLASITDNVTFDNEKKTVSYGEGVVTLIVEQEANGWTFRKNATQYLKENAAKSLAWDNKANATVWTIGFDEGNVVIANAATPTNKMYYNAGYPRFLTYATSGQKAIQLYGKANAITSGTTNVSALGNMDDEIIVASGEGVILNVDVAPDSVSYVAKNGATIVISATNEATKTTKSVIADEKSKIEVTAPTTVNQTFSVAATMGGGISGQIAGSNLVTIAQSTDAYFDITLGDNANPEHWHAIAVPFPVDVINGIYDAVTGNKLENEVNYAIMEYHGNLRAQGLYGWKKIRTTLMPGVFYLMTVDGNTKTFRFKMAGTVLPTGNDLKLTLHKYAVSPNVDGTNGGWNGVANPTLEHGMINKRVQVLDPATYTYKTILAKDTNFVVGTPFFIQSDADETNVVMEAADPTKPYYAPKRVAENKLEEIKVTFGNEQYTDKLYISASEDATNEYQIGKDLAKMSMTATPKVAQICGNAYGTILSIIDAPMVNDKAEYSLTLYAPNAGEYTISAPAMENADLYLTYNGSIIWNLSTSEYTNDFEKGNNEGYGLLLVKKIAGMATGCESIEAQKTGVQKIVINDKVFILRAGQMYDVTGKMVK